MAIGRKNKQVVLSHAEQIAQAESKFNEAQIMFSQAHDSVTAADQVLDQVIADALQKMAELEAIVENANAGKDKNTRFKAKLTEFLEV